MIVTSPHKTDLLPFSLPKSSIMSTAIHDFFTSELKLVSSSNYIVTTISEDNAKPLPSFEYNKIGRPSLKRLSSRSAHTPPSSNKKDHRWGETRSLSCQWDFSPGHAPRRTLSSTTRSAVATEDDSANVSMVVKEERLTFEVRADQALLTGAGTSHVHRQDVSAGASQTAPPLRMMYHSYHSSSSSMPSLCDPLSDKHLCDNNQEAVKNVINNCKQFGHRAAMEITKNGGRKSPQPPRRQISLNSKAA